MHVLKISNSIEINSIRNTIQSNKQNHTTPLQNLQINEIPNNNFNRYLVSFKGTGANLFPKRQLDVPIIKSFIERKCFRANIRHPEPNIITGSNGYFDAVGQNKFSDFLFLKERGGLDAFIYLGDLYDQNSREKAAELLKKADLDFHHFNFSSFWNENSYLIKDEATGEIKGVKDEIVQDLKKFFELLKTKNVYMGCDQGRDRTNIAIWLNHCLNQPNGTMSYEFAHTLPNTGREPAEQLFKYLSDEQKSMLNIKDFNATNRFDDFVKNESSASIDKFGWYDNRSASGNKFNNFMKKVSADEEAKREFIAKFNESELKGYTAPTMTDLLAKFYDIPPEQVNVSIEMASKLGIPLKAYTKILHVTENISEEYGMSTEAAIKLVVERYLPKTQ